MTNIYDIPKEANLHNACIEPCDVINMPCVCGSWHDKSYYDRRLREERRKFGSYTKVNGIIFVDYKVVRLEDCRVSKDRREHYG